LHNGSCNKQRQEPADTCQPMIHNANLQVVDDFRRFCAVLVCLVCRQQAGSSLINGTHHARTQTHSASMQALSNISCVNLFDAEVKCLINQQWQAWVGLSAVSRSPGSPQRQKIEIKQ
jgi:hypothetical protein